MHHFTQKLVHIFRTGKGLTKGNHYETSHLTQIFVMLPVIDAKANKGSYCTMEIAEMPYRKVTSLILENASQM